MAKINQIEALLKVLDVLFGVRETERILADDNSMFSDMVTDVLNFIPSDVHIETLDKLVYERLGLNLQDELTNESTLRLIEEELGIRIRVM